MPKYVTYNTEIYDKAKGSKRSFFCIEDPILPTVWSSSKSNKVSYEAKYQETLKRLDEIDRGIIILEPKKIYPIGIRINSDSTQFILDWRDKYVPDEEKRYTIRMKINSALDIETNYENFLKQIKNKYPDLVLKT